MRGENVAVIFGLKLRHLREAKGYGLKELSERVGLSPSYLNEIEKGKKYPKADKILQLAEALEVGFDDLVSLKLSPPYSAIESLLDSPILQAVPLSLLGLTPRDVIELITRSPREVGAFLQTLAGIARSYDMHVEHFFHAMLRSYQETHDNYFAEIEAAADKLRQEQDWEGRAAIGLAELSALLRERYGVDIEEEGLAGHPELSGFRSVWAAGPPERLLLNPRLSDRQKAFQVGREIGYRELSLGERGVTSSRAEPASFEQVLNDFKASYYAGAILIDQEQLVADLRALFRSEGWEPEAFRGIMERFQVTPEMFLYRLTQILPRRFHLRHYHFIRVSHDPARGSFQVNKLFNMSGLLIPTGVLEHYCRRWIATDLLATLRARLSRGERGTPILGAQRVRYLHSGEQYFLISLARPLALTPGVLTSVTLGFLVDRVFQRTVRFWNDPAVPETTVHFTCERCGLSPEQCDRRAAPPDLYQEELARAERARALERLLEQGPERVAEPRPAAVAGPGALR
jgi:transcriptional regulator with XRE-family HTH domain